MRIASVAQLIVLSVSTSALLLSGCGGSKPVSMAMEALAKVDGNALRSSAITSETTGPAALQFVPVTPCRIVDTRNAAGPFGGPELAAKASREFDIPQSACGIPSTAVAYSLNVTVVPNASLGYLTLWPTGEAQPNVSTLNSDGRLKANAAITPAGTNGGVSVYVTDATQLILDIDGYFVPAGTISALAFYPLTPCRVADTRQATGPLGAPFLGAGSSRAFPILSSSCNIPSMAQAYSLNVTAIPHKTLDYLTSWPTGESQPNVSTLNSSTGAVTANAAIVPAGSGGEVSIFVSDAADVILDINGYFAPPATGGLSLFPVTPCRVIDTRSGAGPFNGVFQVGVEASACAPPATAQAYVFNATVVPPGPLNYLTLWPAGESQPLVSTLNADDGAITSNMAIVPTNNGSIDAFSSNATNLILDISSYFAPSATLPQAATPTFSLTSGSYDGTQSVTITDATPGAQIYYTTNGTLPTTGSTLYTGAIMVSSSETLQAIAVATNFSQSAIATASFTIAAPLSFTTSTLTNAIAGSAYVQVIETMGGIGPYTFGVTSGSIPSWITASPLSPATSANGELSMSGTPLTANVGGPFNFTLKVTDSKGATASQQFSITVTNATNATCTHDGSANSLLKGHYAYTLVGFDPNANRYDEIGSFEANGSGTISNGSGDVNSSGFATAGEQQYSFSGTYSIGDAANDDRGIATWINSNTAATGLGATSTYCFSADTVTSGVAYSGWMIEADGSGFVRTGYFEIQDPADFTAAAFNGGYVFGVEGTSIVSGDLVRAGAAGRLNFNGTGGLSGGALDSAKYEPSTSSLRYEANQAVSSSGSSYTVGAGGRGVLTVNSPGGATAFVIYSVGYGTKFLMLSSANINTNSLLFGAGLVQTTTSYTSGNIAASGIFRRSGTTSPAATPIFDDVTVGQFNFNGSGGVAITQDENSGGTVTGPTASNATYTFTSAGYLTITEPDGRVTNFYLLAPGAGFGITSTSSDTGVDIYDLTTQTVPTGGFTSTSASGSYGVGTGFPYAYHLANSQGPSYPGTEEGTVTLSSGTATIVEDAVVAPGLPADVKVDHTGDSNSYLLDSTYGATTGRILFQKNGTTNVAGYIVSPTEVYLIEVTPGEDSLFLEANHE